MMTKANFSFLQEIRMVSVSFPYYRPRLFGATVCKPRITSYGEDGENSGKLVLMV